MEPAPYPLHKHFNEDGGGLSVESNLGKDLALSLDEYEKSQSASAPSSRRPPTEVSQP